MTPYLVKSAKSGSYLKIEEIAAQCDLHPELIERFVCLGLIDPVEKDPADGAWLFDESAVPIVRKIVLKK
ncbi:MAG: hypothetical protein WHS38_02555 [Thermodesulforhabdaceae bacterium]